MKIIAHIENDFPTKFGIPRQSGLVNSLRSRIVFAPEYRNPDAFRGLEDFSHVWLIWEFSQAVRQKWSPTVRPPRLGGNTRMGVFATRSPFRPNPVGLSAVQLEEVVLHGADAPYLVVSGADLMNGTPIYDIKPYLPHIDSHPDARGGFAVPAAEHRLKVVFPEQWLEKVPEQLRDGLTEVLAQDPRPSYQHDPERVYGFGFARLEVKFTVDGDVLTVCGVTAQKCVSAPPNLTFSAKNFGNPLQIVSFYGMINLYSSEPVSTSWYRLLPYLCGLPCRCRNQHRKILIKGDTTYAVWLL